MKKTILVLIVLFASFCPALAIEMTLSPRVRALRGTAAAQCLGVDPATTVTR